MSSSNGEIRTRFDELKPGDRIEVQHTLTVGGESRSVTICGLVVRTERRRQGRACGCGPGDKPPSDVILLELSDGELTSVAVDESTVLRRA